MTINQHLLIKARAAAERLAETESEVQRARTEYHSIVRRMHLAGSSLREIAQALGLSHQRVQQIVQATGGSWWQRIWRSRDPKGDLVCTFCLRSQNHVSKLIAGPNVYICERCVAVAERNRTRSTSSAEGPFILANGSSRARCSFCRKGGTADRSLLTGSRGNICGDCLGVCRQILQDSSDAGGGES